ncbi:hypothetical protein [Rhizobium leguminosarum]|uniref:hypothetical protein n=1 Tax=Rhizobium leguminosarum TaxID=384 RepID=UPI001C97F9A3|nr:hypothetical protein [Rhizobium leguminosarum]MBY5550355.1 hypothetical protein [Rhizobium leguminosarum]MBY5582437.1 hypothetical protein [Rhizobium leguminosarum]MBY5606606.1 hypothetical protein [Rhizobium leguminosarum]MBY5651896.1 hypothetical protein [Rhizobium leguminosarum]MBY5653430.1 hypothetical protein [Rhizobium leguminosarum]
MRHITLSALLNLALITGASASEDLSDVWRDLFTRCRLAVESGKDFDATGLRDLGRDVKTVAPVTDPRVPFPLLLGYQVTKQRWEVPESRFVVVEAEYPPQDGKSRRSCKLEIVQGAKPISTAEEKHLRATFFAERDELLSTGRYERWNPDAIFSTNLGVRLAGHNPHGCRVVSYLDIETQRAPSFLVTGSAEQDGACGSAPRFAHP